MTGIQRFELDKAIKRAKATNLLQNGDDIMSEEKGYFVQADPEENRKQLAELAKTEEGARAIRDFEREYEFRKKLAKARKEANLSQAEIAERSGLKQQAISRFESGNQDSTVTLPTLLRCGCYRTRLIITAKTQATLHNTQHITNTKQNF